MEKFGLLQLLSSFAKNLQPEEKEEPQQQNILDMLLGGDTQNNTPSTTANTPTAERQTSNSIFTTESRQRQFNNILLRHEEISRRIDKRNKH